MSRESAPVTVVTDGSCFGNPGPGGWAFLVFHADGEVEKRSGFERDTTNNRMELTAIIEALEHLGQGERSIVAITDSQWLAYCAGGKWKRKANLDLWKRFDAAARGKRIEWRWQRRNVTDAMCEADALAKAAAEQAERQI